MPHISIYPHDEIQEFLFELKKLRSTEEIAVEKAKKIYKVRVGLELKKLAEDARKYVFAEFRKRLKKNRPKTKKSLRQKKSYLQGYEEEEEELDLLRDIKDGKTRKLLTAQKKRLLMLKRDLPTDVHRESFAQLGTAGNATFKGKDILSKSGQSINLGHEDFPTGLTTEASKVFRYGGYPTISFNMSSRRALEEGWIVSQQPEPDVGGKNLLEWATNRLRQVIKEKENEEEDSKKCGANKPVTIRYYGDSRRETLLKLYRKGNENEKSSVSLGNLIPGKKIGNVPKIPQLSKLDSGQKEVFAVQLPDGTTSVLYPKNGQTAIVASAVPGEAGQLYVHCYGNDSDHTPLASFTPYGKSCCYHKNGDPALVLTEEGGVMKTESGNVHQKWVWPEQWGKLREPIEYQINKEMLVRIIARNNINLCFSSNRESIKIPVGTVPGINAPQILSKIPSAMLQSGFSSSLRSAVDYAQHFRPPEGKPKHKSKQKLKRSQHKKSTDTEALRQGLDPPDRFEFDSQADRELHRLENKTRLLVDDWMEHYRVAIGVSSPSLMRMLDKPQVPLPPRKVHSAKERKKSVEEEVDEKQFQSFRSPSAPPRHLLPGPQSLTVEDKRPKMKKGAHDKKSGETPHVRIEIQPTATLSDSMIAEVRRPQLIERPSHESKLRPSTQMLHRQTRSRAHDFRKVRSAHSLPSSDSRKSRKVSYALLCDGCPVVTREKLTADDKKDSPKLLTCKCSKHKTPLIHDVELDYFLHRVAPMTQLIVVCIINSLYPRSNPYGRMFDHIYIEKNKNRTHPCRQAKYDQYRILYYDLALAKSRTKRSSPLLLTRHNVVPGMVLMYCGGRLLFADHIFNGYGNAKNDFRKQVFLSRREYTLGHFLPDDFRFTPQSGKSGPRAAWGGEVGGAGVNGKGKSGMFSASSSTLRKCQSPNSGSGDLLRGPASSEVTSRSSIPVTLPTSKNYETSREFVQFSLSAQNYFGQPMNRNHYSQIATARSALDISNTHLSPTFSLVNEGPHSALGINRPVQSRGPSGFVRMQAVK